MESIENYCELRQFAGQNCNDGPEVQIINNELKNRMAEFLEFIVRNIYRGR